MPGTDNINADLTDEEREAMEELNAQMADTDADDPLFDPGDVVAPGEGLTPEQEQADEAAAAAALVATEATTAAALEAAAAKADLPPARAPLLIADAPEDADAKLADIATKRADLGDKFDDGDMTSKEYQAALGELNKEERTLERAIDKAQMAQDLENQRITNDRMLEIDAFLKEVGIPHDPKNLRFRVLDAAVRDVAGDEANVNLSAREVMQKAMDLCVSEGALQPKKAVTEPAKVEPPKKTPIKAVPSLANMPASEVTSTEDNRFAYLNRLSNPDQREAAFAKLSPADQDAYLATGG